MILLSYIMNAAEVDLGLFKIKIRVKKPKTDNKIGFTVADLSSISYVKTYTYLLLKNNKLYRLGPDGTSKVKQLFFDASQDENLFYDLKPKGRIRYLLRKNIGYRFEIVDNQLNILK